MNKNYSFRRSAIQHMLFVFILLQSASVSATPGLQNPASEMRMAAYLVFPAGRNPGAQGEFEIEIHCKSYVMQSMVAINIGYSEEIVLKPVEMTTSQRTHQLFKGRMEKGEVKTWRMNGIINKNAIYKGEEMPSSIVLYVDFPCPPESHRVGGLLGTVIENDLPVHKKMGDTEERERADKICHITKALPVWLPERKNTN